MSPKRKQGEEGEVLYPSNLARPRRKVTVLDIRDLEGEYLLVLARLQLIKMDADPTRAIGLYVRHVALCSDSLIGVVPLPWQSFDFPFPFSIFSFFRSVSGPQLSPQESVALLTQAGLFDNAFTVAFHFNLPKETIFEGLASRLAKHKH